MTSIVQIRSSDGERAVSLVDGNSLHLLKDVTSAYELAQRAIDLDIPAGKLIHNLVSERRLSYDETYSGRSAWKLLPAFDHPLEIARCSITGTGLTHLSSAATRQAMHAVQMEETDSIKMYRCGVEGGQPGKGQIGISPEWFHKGNGSILRAHGEPLSIPSFALDGGEEAEVAGIYVVDPDGSPRRVGFAAGNEFSDHVLERKNYLYLAHSKLRECALGPELVLDSDFQDFRGHVRVERGGEVIWNKQIRSGERNMVHSLANIEHHHFKYSAHRRPGDVHIHFFGADAFSFGDGIALHNDDVVEIFFESIGRPLRNRIWFENGSDILISVRTI